MYGAFGYGLVLGFVPVPLRQERAPHDRTLVLHLPDRVLHLDRRRGTAALLIYDFSWAGRGTDGLFSATPPAPCAPPAEPRLHRDHAPGAYADLVRRAKERFRSSVPRSRPAARIGLRAVRATTPCTPIRAPSPRRWPSPCARPMPR
ncbi:hypothetical protein [Streptomyces incarnatus]|uniref:hypothetical protein n=1 Tax=Streptomyces incarnatus TaxID=665007 RepID=UPI001FC95783|nr:hypothetical protein [Streptomyces incarnatus]